MLTEEQLEQLRSENELLQLELEDINEAIRRREAELEQLRATAREVTVLQSKLDMDLLEFEQMQRDMNNQLQVTAGVEQRAVELEEELLASFKTQQQYADVVKDYTSVKANLEYTETELQEANGLYRRVKDLESSLAGTKSDLEIAQLEIDSLRAELEETRSLYELIKSTKIP